MRRLLALCILLVATAAAAAPVTVGEILAAHRAGATPEGLISYINAAESIAPVGTAELAALQEAGVPEAVVQALVARAPAPPPTPAPARPDDPRLVDVVRLVKAGLSESLVAEQVRSSGIAYKLSVNDLIYLKENQVPESTIAALLSSASGAVLAATSGPPPTPEPPKDVTFQPLVRQQGGFFVKNPVGSLALKGDRLEWYDEQKPDRNFSVFTRTLQSVWLVCEPRPQGNVCFELGFKTLAGDEYSFRDVNWDAGGNAMISSVLTTLKERFPNLVYHEKVKD